MICKENGLDRVLAIGLGCVNSAYLWTLPLLIMKITYDYTGNNAEASLRLGIILLGLITSFNVLMLGIGRDTKCNDKYDEIGGYTIISWAAISLE